MSAQNEIHPVTLVQKWSIQLDTILMHSASLKAALSGANVDPIVQNAQQMKSEIGPMLVYIKRWAQKDQEELDKKKAADELIIKKAKEKAEAEAKKNEKPKEEPSTSK